MICSFDEISLSRTYCAGSLSVCFMKYSNISVSMRSARSCMDLFVSAYTFSNMKPRSSFVAAATFSDMRTKGCPKDCV